MATTTRYEDSISRLKRKRQKSFRPSTKRWKLDALYDIILEEINEIEFGVAIFAEVLAEKHRAKKDLVVQILAKMIIEGILARPFNSAHDTKRSRLFYINTNGWAATRYFKRQPK